MKTEQDFLAMMKEEAIDILHGRIEHIRNVKNLHNLQTSLMRTADLIQHTQDDVKRVKKYIEDREFFEGKEAVREYKPDTIVLDWGGLIPSAEYIIRYMYPTEVVALTRVDCVGQLREYVEIAVSEYSEIHDRVDVHILFREPKSGRQYRFVKLQNGHCKLLDAVISEV